VSPAAVGAVGVPGVAVTTGISSPVITEIKFQLIQQLIPMKGLGILSKNVSDFLCPNVLLTISIFVIFVGFFCPYIFKTSPGLTYKKEEFHL
jgi:hypothetical protein